MGKTTIVFTDGQTMTLESDKESYLAIIKAMESRPATITLKTSDAGLFSIPFDKIKFVWYKE